MKYVFFLGRHPMLSVAELGSFFGKAISFDERRGVGWYDGELPCPPQEFLRRLGGTMQIDEVIAEKLRLDEVIETLTSEVVALGEASKHKVRFGLSFFGESHHRDVLKSILPVVKKAGTAAGVSCGFVNKPFHNVDRVFVLKQKMLDEGTAFSVIARDEEHFFLTRTVGVQDVDAYGRRDYGKAARDAKVGMLPPKLAQVMLNIGTAIGRPSGALMPGKDAVVCDPFCGSGSLLIEAMLMGFDVVGSDASSEMVAAAEKNLTWLRESHEIDPALQTIILKNDARDLSALAPHLKRKTAYIITEPFLGPPMSTPPSERQLSQISHELGELYLAFFEAARPLLAPQSSIVFLFPFWQRGEQKPYFSSSGVVAKIEALGYSRSAFDPLQVKSICYSRPDQIVGRELMRFVPKV